MKRDFRKYNTIHPQLQMTEFQGGKIAPTCETKKPIERGRLVHFEKSRVRMPKPLADLEEHTVLYYSIYHHGQSLKNETTVLLTCHYFSQEVAQNTEARAWGRGTGSASHNEHCLPHRWAPTKWLGQPLDAWSPLPQCLGKGLWIQGVIAGLQNGRQCLAFWYYAFV